MKRVAAETRKECNRECVGSRGRGRVEAVSCQKMLFAGRGKTLVVDHLSVDFGLSEPDSGLARCLSGP